MGDQFLEIFNFKTCKSKLDNLKKQIELDKKDYEQMLQDSDEQEKQNLQENYDNNAEKQKNVETLQAKIIELERNSINGDKLNEEIKRFKKKLDYVNGIKNKLNIEILKLKELNDDLKNGRNCDIVRCKKAIAHL
jgi:hypothetical protein